LTKFPPHLGKFSNNLGKFPDNLANFFHNLTKFTDTGTQFSGPGRGSARPAVHFPLPRPPDARATIGPSSTWPMAPPPPPAQLALELTWERHRGAIEGMKTLLCLSALLWAAITPLATAGSATWAKNPASGDWNTAANWRPQTVPNSPSDIATFGTSNVTNVTNTDVIVNLDSLVFSSGAPSYTISALDNIALDGIGIVNNSGIVQSFVAGAFIFNNSLHSW